MTPVKHDSGKPPVAAVYPEFISGLADVLGYGDKKYGKFNWAGGLGCERLISAAQRHMLAYQSGEDFDPESGKSNLLCAASCLMMLYYNQRNHPDLDDRRFKRGQS